MRWWWFGPAVVKPELRKELETMRSAGIGGVEIQPVYPLTLDDPGKDIHNFPYLSPEFLEDVSFANSTARSLGLRVDITLGSGWPYGGPKTTLALAAGRLRVAAVPISSPAIAPPPLAPGESIIAAFAVNGTEKSFDPAGARQIDLATGAVPKASGPQAAIFFIASHTRQTVKRAAMGAEGYVLDHFSRAAIDEHLADVGTPLVNAFGSKPPYSVFSDSLEVYGSDWTANLPAEFRKRRGYDLIPHLPQLLAGGTPEAEAVRHDWGLTLSQLVRENYLAPLTAFAEAHHTRFRSQTYGEPAVTLADEAVANLPEGEGPQWRAFSFTRWASSANHLYGRNVTSAETWTWLHSPAFRATPLDMKVEADRMFLLGVNQFVGHGYPYSPAGAGEPGWAFYAAGAFNSHNPWFPVMPDVMRYLQRISWLLRQGKPANDIAILLPEDDAQAAFTPGHVSVTDEMKRRITPELMAAILDAGYNIDYIDAASIQKLGTVPYPVLILPSTERIPLNAYKTLARYADSGGKIISIGETPSRAPGLLEQKQDEEITALSSRLFGAQGARAGGIVVSIDELAGQIRRSLAPDLDSSGHMTGVGFIHRRLPQSDVYFVANTSNLPIDGTLKFRAVRSFLQEWDPDNGKIIASTQYRPDIGISVALAPYESRIFVVQDKSEMAGSTTSTSIANPQVSGKVQIVDLSKQWQIRFPDTKAPLKMNALDTWTNLAGRAYYSGEAVYWRTFTLEQNQSAIRRIFLDFGTGAPTVDTRPPNANGIHALLDPPIREAAVIFVNGQRVGTLWHPPYRIDITNAAHQGRNQIEVRVYNTAINELAGQPPHDYSALYAQLGKRFEPQDMNNLQP
ncbi:MAG: glycosyl hydrolase, partial [Terracidiphilus sp.]